MSWFVRVVYHLICSGYGPVMEDGSFWFPPAAAKGAAEIDWVFHFILWISIFFFVLIVALLVAFAWLYRARAGFTPKPAVDHDNRLEFVWIVVPSILAVFIFYFGLQGFISARNPPSDSQEIRVTGQKWSWTFTYPNGVVDPELHLPVDESTQLTLRSEDVIHSFFVPAFRTKMDVVPGRYTKTWFHPTEPGTYQAYCTEYCGLSHSAMLAKVIVHEKGGYERWLEQAGSANEGQDPVALGGKLYISRGCAQCHSVDGKVGIAPTFLGLYGRTEKFTDGSTLVADENYMHESIVEPQAKIVAGYPPVMPTYKGKLKDSEIEAIIAYIKTLK